MNKVVWGIVNAFVMGIGTFGVAWVDGEVTRPELLASSGLAVGVMVTWFSSFWRELEPPTPKLFCNFLGVNK